ncbi:MAG TPA: hydroxymethylglutaryl-CoA lyase [Acidimicrobiales bacterium]|nr:hydroxymethylglutaryl-CoA lyase [Acidimicrobiales bacterium]
MRTPAAVSLGALPSSVTIYEVGARDGLQNESTVVDVATKVEFIRRLIDSGLRNVELTSFVPASWVPQLADAEEVLARLGSLSGRHPVLVPNERGLERALASGVREIAVFASATETFAQRNLNRTIRESLDAFAVVVARALSEGLAVRGYVSMCFGDPWEGNVAPGQVVEVARALLDMGCGELSLGDTIGVATPGAVARLLEALGERDVRVGQIAVHFHDTYGQALANTLAALERGVTTVDSSAGGLGGCPYAGSATGNLATEDLVWLLHGLGIETGVDLEALCRTSLWMAQRLGRPSPSRTLNALAATITSAEVDDRRLEEGGLT